MWFLPLLTSLYNLSGFNCGTFKWKFLSLKTKKKAAAKKYKRVFTQGIEFFLSSRQLNLYTASYTQGFSFHLHVPHILLHKESKTLPILFLFLYVCSKLIFHKRLPIQTEIPLHCDTEYHLDIRTHKGIKEKVYTLWHIQLKKPSKA